MRRANRLQLICINLTAIALLILLFYNLLAPYKIEHYFIAAATLIMIVHIWWGARLYIKNVEYTRNLLDLLIDVLLVGLLAIAMFSLNTVVRWFIVFGTFFAIVIIKYTMGLFRTEESKVEMYIKTKIKIESLVVLLFYFSAIMGSVFDYWWVPVFLSMAVFLAQIPFIYWLVFRKGVYKIPFE